MKSSHMVAIYRPTYLDGFKWLLGMDLKGWTSFLLGTKTTEIPLEEIFARLTLGQSLIRWGDGETANLRVKNTWHQQGDPELSSRLYSLLEAINNQPEVLFGLPLKGFEETILKPNSFFWKNRKQLWSTRALFSKRQFRNLLHTPRVDAGLFYIHYELIPKMLSEIDATSRDVLYISSEPSPALLHLTPKMTFMRIPDKNAFNDVLGMEVMVEKWLEASRNPLLLFAGGSAVKALCSNLIHKCQVIDLGTGVRFLEPGEKRMGWEQS